MKVTVRLEFTYDNIDSVEDAIELLKEEKIYTDDIEVVRVVKDLPIK